MAEANEASVLPAYHGVEKLEVIKVGILGLLVGIGIPLLGNAITMWVIEPIFCKDAGSFMLCASGGLWGYYISAVLLTVVAVSLLVNWNVYRPLIIALGALVALWGLKAPLEPILAANFWEFLSISAVLFSASYLIFYWFMRVRHFGLSLCLAVLAATLIRWALLTQ